MYKYINLWGPSVFLNKKAKTLVQTIVMHEIEINGVYQNVIKYTMKKEHKHLRMIQNSYTSLVISINYII